MYIKELRIKGFLSIKNEIWNDLHPKFNVIVGKNGTGKSTFLQAIRFVLTDDFPCKTEQEKINILNDIENYARVDIMIENSDKRILKGEDIVRLARQVDLMHNYYYIKDKLVQKSYFYKILEFANFTVKHPIYIVPQGHACRLALISNQERLNILKEFSGYDYAQGGEELIIQYKREADQKMLLIEKMLGNLAKEHEELEESISKLNQYNALKNKVDTLTKIVYNHKLEKIEGDLYDFEKKKEKIKYEIINFKEDFIEAEKKETELSESLKSLKILLKSLKQKRKDALAKIPNIKGSLSGVNRKFKDTEEELKYYTKKEREADAKMKELKKKIKDLKNEVTKIHAKYEESSEELKETSRVLVSKEQELKEIFVKKGLKLRQFSNMAEKDEWIKNEISRLQIEINKTQTELQKLNTEIKAEEELQTKMNNEIKTLRRYSTSQISVIESDNRTLNNLIEDKKNLFSQKLEYLQEQRNIKEKELSTKESEFQKLSSKLRSSIPKAIYNGITSVQKVLDVLKERGDDTSDYFGLLIDVIQVGQERNHTVIENIARNSLFKHVVATENCATKILKEMEKLDLPGEANFLPLDRLRYLKPPLQVEDTINPLCLVKYDDKFDGAVRSVLGNTLICRDLNLCEQYAKQYKIDCITTGGDRVLRNGYLSGGSQDVSKMRLQMYLKRKELTKEIESLRSELGIIEKQIDIANQERIKIDNEITKISAKLNVSNSNYNQIKMELETKELALTSSLELLSQMKKNKDFLDSKLNTLELKVSSLKSDLNQELCSQLTEEEKELTFRLEDEIKELRREEREKYKKVIALKMNKKKDILNGLEWKYEKCKQEKEDAMLMKEELKQQITILQSNKIDLTEKDIVVESQETYLTKDLIKAKEEGKSIEIKLENVRKKKFSLEKRLEVNNTLLSNINCKIETLEEQKLNVEKEISNLNYSKTLARKFLDCPMNKLTENLEKSRKKLQKIGFIPNVQPLFDKVSELIEENQTALENIKLNKDFKGCLKKIQNITYEALEETIAEVSENFNDFFKQFIPEGQGELVKSVADFEDTNDNFTGIDVNVSFSEGKMQNILSLSGGEKTLVSVQLMLAVLKSNPPPFYIFDETDEALTESNAVLLRSIIREISSTIQCFVTSFKHQMKQGGNKHFEVTFRQNSSHIQAISREEIILEEETAWSY